MLTDDRDFKKLVTDAMARFNALTAEEQAAHRFEQRVSWVYGEMLLESRVSPKMTRDEVRELLRKHDAESGRVMPYRHRPVPTLDERARWFHSHGTTVAELCDRAGRRGPTLAGRVVLRVIRIVAAVANGLAKGMARK